MPTAAEQFMPELIRTLRSYAPTVTADTDAQGRESSILTIRNPRDSRWSLQFICPNQPDRHGELYGSLWFGAVEITGYLSAGEAGDTIQAVLNGEMTCVLRYRNEDALNDHRPSSGWRKVFLTSPAGDEDAALAALRARLRTPVTIRDRLAGTYIGIIEFANWRESDIITRLPGKKERNRT